jgi:hypothetical protein
MTNAPRSVALLGATIITALLLTACGGTDAADDDGVASLDEGGGTTSEAAATESATSDEEAMLEYVECLRGEGLDVPDPQVNADGGLELRIGGPDGGEDQEPIDPEEFEAAREVCGDPPQRAGGNFSPEDQAAFQDAALEFAQCMRDRGYDVPDPDFQGEGGVIFRRNSGLDSDDPEQQAVAEECQEESFGNLQPPGGGPAGDDTESSGNGS